MPQKHVRSLGANEILELIFVYLTEISSLRDPDEILEVLANMGRALTSADRCSVWVISDDKKEIWTKVAHGVDEIRIPMGSGIVGSSIVSGEKVIIDDVYKDPRFNQSIDKKTGYRTKSMMVIPLYDNDDEIIGAFQVINHIGEKDSFDKRDIERLMLASTYAAETLISAKLTQEIEDTQREVVFTMGAIGESRSKETGNHVKRVADYSKILAKAYGMDEEEAELLKQASPMHDIGKIAIPDAILKKPGRFDENEREIMNSHAELGYHMIKDSKRPLLKAAAIVAYQHHEKWNGTGYPQKLKGEEIHIYGRITAIADVFDALGSDRVYKKAWSDERIFKLFKEERGEHFDPKLVDLFFENIDALLEVRSKFSDQYQAKVEYKEGETNIKILGAYGSRGKGLGTSSFLLNNKTVIDAGNLLDSLDVASTEIENIWITHSHLDHIYDIAYILDNYYALRKKTLNIYGLPKTIQTIKENFLNNTVWPDFSQISLLNSKEKCVKYVEIELNKEYKISETEIIKPIYAEHTVDTCGYVYIEKGKGIVFSSDTISLSSVLEEVNENKNISTIMVECSFPSDMQNIADVSKHLTPKKLFKELEKLKRDDISIYINHLKPSYLTKIEKEIAQYKGSFELNIVKDGEILQF